MKKLRESQKKALDKFYKNNKQLNVTVSNTIYNILVEYCEKYGYSKREIIEKAIQAYIDNN